MAKCKYCEIEIEFETDRWVDVQEGGVYDYCAIGPEPEQGHRPKLTRKECK